MSSSSALVASLGFSMYSNMLSASSDSFTSSFPFCITFVSFSYLIGETMETVSDFIFGGSKITAGGDCSHEIKRHSLEGNYDQPR